jgi:hypothetical protein
LRHHDGTELAWLPLDFERPRMMYVNRAVGLLAMVGLLAGCGGSQTPATPIVPGAVRGWTRDLEERLRRSCPQYVDCTCFTEGIERKLPPTIYFRYPAAPETTADERQVEAQCSATALWPHPRPQEAWELRALPDEL